MSLPGGADRGGVVRWFPGQPRSLAARFRPAAPPLGASEREPAAPSESKRSFPSALTSQRVVHATNATVQLQDTQRFHPLATATAAWKLGLPVLRFSYSPLPAPLPSFLVPPLFSSPTSCGSMKGFKGQTTINKTSLVRGCCFLA